MNEPYDHHPNHPANAEPNPTIYGRICSNQFAGEHEAFMHPAIDQIPIIAIKYSARDPVGFIGEKQAMKASFDRPNEAARKVVQILIDSLGQKQRLQQVLIAAFLASPDWDAARDRFNRMQATVTSLNDEEMKSIQNGFAQNDQLYRSIYLTNQNRRLERFLEKATGKIITVQIRLKWAPHVSRASLRSARKSWR